MTRYRLTYGPRKTARGPWRTTRAGSITDAIDQGLATRDEHNSDRLWWDPMAMIEERNGQ